MSEQQSVRDEEFRDEAWKEFAHREQYGYTDVESNIAFDGGWAAALSFPVIRRIQAEALRDASVAIRTCGDHHPACLRCQDGDALWRRADRIEKGES